MDSVDSDTRINFIKRTITLTGIRPIMFDRYPGDNDTVIPWTEKIYLKPGTNQLVLPTTNINSFLTAHNTSSAPKRLRDPRKYKKLANSLQSFTMIDAIDGGEYINFDRLGVPIEVGEFSETEDPVSGLTLHRAVARLEKGIPNPKERPLLPLPWELTFILSIIPNNEVKEADIKSLFVEGGISIGLGTYRGQYGKFSVTRWD